MCLKSVEVDTVKCRSVRLHHTVSAAVFCHLPVIRRTNVGSSYAQEMYFSPKEKRVIDRNVAMLNWSLMVMLSSEKQGIVSDIGQ